MRKDRLTILLLCVVAVLILWNLNSHFLQNKKVKFSIDALGDCYNDKNKCLNHTIPNILDKYSLKEVMTEIEQNLDKKDIFLMCHEYRIPRGIGFSAAQKSNNFQKTLKSCDGMCYEACYHGVAEAFFTKINKENPTNAINLCQDLKDNDSSNKYLACLYGIGRALMQTSQNDLPYSLESCNSYKTNLGKEGCYAGVFAENSQSRTVSKYFNPLDLKYPCNIISKNYQKTCYAFQARYYLDHNNENLKEGINFCYSIPSAYKEECLRQTIGNLVYTKSASELNNECNLLSIDLREWCVNSISHYLIQRDAGKSDDFKLFCSLVPEQYKDQCI